MADLEPQLVVPNTALDTVPVVSGATALPSPSFPAPPPPPFATPTMSLAANPYGGPAPVPGPQLQPADRSISARFHRGILLTQQAFQVMRELPGLILVPIISVGIIAVLFGLSALLFGADPSGAGSVVWFIAFLPMTSVAMVGQAVITHRVMEHLEGRASTNSQSLRAVLPKLGTIVLWACLSFTVGVTLRSLERGRGIVGLIARILVTAALVAWSALTFFVLPVILFENLTVGAAIKRSRDLVKQSWGEGVVGVGALNVIFTLAVLAAFLLAVLFAAIHAWILAILVLFVAIVGLNLLAAVASPVFTVALYRFATTGQASLGFSQQDLNQAFRPRGRRRRL